MNANASILARAATYEANLRSRLADLYARICDEDCPIKAERMAAAIERLEAELAGR